MMKPTLLILAAGLFAGCSSLKKSSFTSADLLAPEGLSLKAPDQLTSKQVKEDIQLLRYAFEKAYGGRDHVKQLEMNALFKGIEDLQTIDTSMKTDELCKKIDTILLKVSDSHLQSRLNGRNCKSPVRPPWRFGKVGKNVLAAESAKVWKLFKKKMNGKTLGVLAITSFPVGKDAVWDKYFIAIKQLLTTDAIIIDIRGNSGGDDSRGHQLAYYLYGQDFIGHADEIIKSQTPETLALFVNDRNIRLAKNGHVESKLPKWFSEWHKKNLRRYEMARKGELPLVYKRKLSNDGKAFDKNKAYTKPIFLLIDNECASSCESVISFLKYHPYVKTIGENSRGLMHFGHIAQLVLPNSKIIVKMATDFWKYRDGVNREGIGYKPDIRVPSGQNAMDVAIEKIRTLLQ